MRTAQLGDYQRRIREKRERWKLKLERFSTEGIPGLGTSEVSISEPLIVFSGPNGAGKTTILRAIWSVADPTLSVQTPSGKIKITSGNAILNYKWQEKSLISRTSFSDSASAGSSNFPVPVVHLDTAVEPFIYQRRYCSFGSIEEITNGIGSSKIDGEKLEEINYIANRDYREIMLYEIEEGGITTPFFQVTYGIDSYDSRTMGAGELAILHIWWNLDRAKHDSLLLMEEPETFLSPASQTNLANYLLAVTYNKKLTTIITSHSPAIIESVLEDHRIFVFRDGQNVEFVHSPIPHELLKTVGVYIKIDTIIFVEDKAAKIFLSSLLDRFDPNLGQRVEISDRQGSGNITSLLQQIGGLFRNIKAIGVFDGDQRGVINSEILKFSAFLPGDDAIEIVFKNLVTSDVQGASEALARPRLNQSLFQLQGCDHHDWYIGLCKNLSLSEEQVFQCLFNLWLSKNGNRELAESTISEIRAALAAKK